ncbi:MAG: hypothetical protein QNK11_04120 [Legionella sp.]|nr:hypothetical protein [Legionella sp.]
MHEKKETNSSEQRIVKKVTEDEFPPSYNKAYCDWLVSECRRSKDALEYNRKKLKTTEEQLQLTSEALNRANQINGALLTFNKSLTQANRELTSKKVKFSETASDSKNRKSLLDLIPVITPISITPQTFFNNSPPDSTVSLNLSLSEFKA